MSGELTYGLECLAMFLQGVDNLFDLIWMENQSTKITYRDVFHQNEVEMSTYNFKQANVELLFKQFDSYEQEAARLIIEQLPLAAYEMVLKASHTFNLLDARRAIAVTERQRYMLRIKKLAQAVAEAYLQMRERLGFPLLEKVAHG